MTLNFLQEKKEADFRYGLVRVRENSESIAFYGGEENEMQLLLQRFRSAFENLTVWMIWSSPAVSIWYVLPHYSHAFVRQLPVLSHLEYFPPFYLQDLTSYILVWCCEKHNDIICNARVQGYFTRQFHVLSPHPPPQCWKPKFWRA